MSIINDTQNALGGAGKSLGSTLEWSKSFVSKYANWLLVIVLVMVLGKAFKLNIKV